MDMELRPQPRCKSFSVKRAFKYAALTASLLVSPVSMPFANAEVMTDTSRYSIYSVLDEVGIERTSSKYDKMKSSVIWLFDASSDLQKTKEIYNIYFENLGINKRSVKLFCNVANELSKKDSVSVTPTDLVNQLAYINGDTAKKELRTIPHSVFYVISRIGPAFDALSGKEQEKPAGPARNDTIKPAEPESIPVAIAEPKPADEQIMNPKRKGTSASASAREIATHIRRIRAGNNLDAASAREISERIKKAEAKDSLTALVDSISAQLKEANAKEKAAASAKGAYAQIKKEKAKKALVSFPRPAAQAEPESIFTKIIKNSIAWELAMIALAGGIISAFLFDGKKKRQKKKETALISYIQNRALAKAGSVIKRMDPKANVPLNPEKIISASIRTALSRITKSRKAFRKNKATAVKFLDSVRETLLLGYSRDSVIIRAFDASRKQNNL
ncbi:MAG: hypothetical protein NTY68_02710 [Candidatus Micrarchaeota archaeon]|nr:hypothetical protein [Candidatus Micrarchaeota archaeon]